MRRTGPAVLLAAMLLLSASMTSARAAHPLQSLFQYGHRAWRVQDGTLPTPTSIAQTRDGYLWIGTMSGLLRFDGIRFVEANAIGGDSLKGVAVLSLLGTSDGNLWVGSRGFIARIRDGHLTRFPIPGRVLQIIPGDEGAVWFVQVGANGHGGALCGVVGDSLTCHGNPELPLDNASAVSKAADGFWIGSTAALCHWSPGSESRCYLQKTLEQFRNLMGVTAVQALPDGSAWVGIGHAGPDLGLGRMVDGQWSPFNAPGFEGRDLPVSMTAVDRQSSLWVGTLGRGLYRIHEGIAERFTVADGLTSDTVDGNFLEDREGTMWVTTSGGLDAFRRLPVAVFSQRQGLTADHVGAVLAATDGTIWVSGDALTTIVDDRVVPLPAGLPSAPSANAMLQDHRGRLWMSIGHSLQILGGPQAKVVLDKGRHPVGVVRQMAEDVNGDVYALTVGQTGHLIRVSDDAVVEDAFRDRMGDGVTAVRSSPAGDLWVGDESGMLGHLADGRLETLPPSSDRSAIVDLLVDSADAVLAATSKGLVVQRGRVRHRLDAGHGLPCERFNTVIRDATANVYLAADCGIVSIESAELDRWFADPDTNVRYRLFDVTDGVEPGVAPFAPRASLGADGRLWFANGQVLAVLDPAMQSVAASAPVLIEEVTADRQRQSLDGPVTLAAKTRDIAVRYTALSFRAPQRISFQYRLDGRDDTWIEAGTRREAFYTDLPPGHYRFHVRAANGDGGLEGDGVFVDFTIPPLYYQTRWFLFLCIVLATMTLYAFYLVRMRQVAAAARERAAIKNAERVRIARDLHDSLLQSTQGLILRFQQVAGRIPPSEPARDMMERALSRADEVLAESRDNVHHLRGGDEAKVDLQAALDATIAELDELASPTRPTIRMTMTGEAGALDGSVGGELLKIVREALNNAVAHAEATLIEVTVAFEPAGLRVSVIDDGVGLPDPVLESGRPGHWGLASMRERASVIGARLVLQRSVSGGTDVTLFVPAAVAFPSERPRPWWRWLSDRGG